MVQEPGTADLGMLALGAPEALEKAAQLCNADFPNTRP
jgi:hypothetical protein